MSTEVATVDPVNAVVQQIRSEAFREQLEAALPENVSVERFARVTVTALRENPDVAAHPPSLLSAVIRCAQDGLLPDTQEAALVVFKTKDGPRVQYLPMIGGFRKIAAEHGWSIRTQVVRQGDHFDFELGDQASLRHRPTLGGGGEVVAAYAIGAHRDGRREIEVMGLDEIEKVRATSRFSERGPWAEWFERMAEKTVGRRLFKKLPLGDRERVARVLDASELGPAGSAELLYGPQAGNLRQIEPPTSSRTDGGSVEQEPNKVEGAAAPSPSPTEPSTAPAPEAGDFDGEEPGEAPAPDDEIVAAAGAVEFASGRYAGQTIAQVHEAGDTTYLAWAMANWKTEPMKGAVTTYVHAKLPGLVK